MYNNQINEQSMHSKLPAPEKMRGPNKPELCFLLRRIFGRRLFKQEATRRCQPFPMPKPGQKLKVSKMDNKNRSSLQIERHN